MLENDKRAGMVAKGSLNPAGPCWYQDTGGKLGVNWFTTHGGGIVYKKELRVGARSCCWYRNSISRGGRMRTA